MVKKKDYLRVDLWFQVAFNSTCFGLTYIAYGLLDEINKNTPLIAGLFWTFAFAVSIAVPANTLILPKDKNFSRKELVSKGVVSCIIVWTILAFAYAFIDEIFWDLI